MTDIKTEIDFPASLVEKYREAITEPVFYHNWLYSVVPISERVEDWVGGQTEINYPLFAYLTGYCKNCNNAFSRKIGSTRDFYSETPMNIPKTGCVAP